MKVKFCLWTEKKSRWCMKMNDDQDGISLIFTKNAHTLCCTHPDLILYLVYIRRPQNRQIAKEIKVSVIRSRFRRSVTAVEDTLINSEGTLTMLIDE